MDTLARAAAIGRLMKVLESKGFEVSQVSDPVEVGDIVAQIGKPYLTPMSAAASNDFTSGNYLPLVARKDGEPAMLGCARLEDLGHEPVDRFWQRVFSRTYGDASGKDVVGRVRPEVVRAVARRLVYFGDLFVNPKFRGMSSSVREFVAIGHLAVSLKWDPDWIYCFIREKDMLRGAAVRYGFSATMPAPFEWLIDPPAPRDRSEVLALLSRDELPVVTQQALRSSEQRDQIRPPERLQGT